MSLIRRSSIALSPVAARLDLVHRAELPVNSSTIPQARLNATLAQRKPRMLSGLFQNGDAGRFTAGLPAENLYYQHRHPYPVLPATRDGAASAVNWRSVAAAAAEMAEAERAVAQGAWGSECTRVRALAGLSTHEARLRVWLADRDEPALDVPR